MIIDTQDIMLVRPIAQNIDSDTRIAPYVVEAETLHILPALGAKLYKEVDYNRSKFKVLLTGGYYDDDTKHFAGLISAVAYLAYSRFVINQNANITPFGVMQKGGEFSTPISSSTLLAMSRDAEKIGIEYLRQCVEYLNFSNGSCSVSTSRRKVKFNAIG